MALTTPVITSIGSFDATTQYIFQFSAEGGDLIVSNELEITNVSTSTIIYQQRQSTYRLEHTLSANTLTNGTNYQVRVRTYSVTSGGTPSEWSNSIEFYCYTTPTIEFTNIPQTSIDATQFEFKVSYRQDENEMLRNYIYNLYSSSNDIIATSGLLTNTLPAIETDLSYTFSGFNNGTYKIECIGYTATETIVSTGAITFTVNYESEHTEVLELTNVCDGGYVNVQTNIDIISYTLNPKPAVYISDKEIDLVSNSATLSYTDNFNIDDSFTLRTWLRDIQYDNGAIYTITFNVGSQGTTPIDSQTTNFKGYLFQLPIPEHSSSYTFDGWYDSNGNLIDEDNIYTENTTIYAHYTAV